MPTALQLEEAWGISREPWRMLTWQSSMPQQACPRPLCDRYIFPGWEDDLLLLGGLCMKHAGVQLRW